MRAYRRTTGWSRAGVPGLEPRLTEPESVVLPITPYPMGVQALGPVPPVNSTRRQVWPPNQPARLQRVPSTRAARPLISGLSAPYGGVVQDADPLDLDLDTAAGRHRADAGGRAREDDVAGE